MADPGLLSHLGRLNQASHRPDTLRCCGSGVRPPHKMAASTQHTRISDPKWITNLVDEKARQAAASHGGSR